MNTNVIVDDEAQTIEKELLNAKVSELFDFLHLKMEFNGGMPVMLGVKYNDVLFRISVEPADEKIVARGYEE